MNNHIEIHRKIAEKTNKKPKIKQNHRIIETRIGQPPKTEAETAALPDPLTTIVRCEEKYVTLSASKT